MKHVLVFGPQACGKTRNKEALAKAFGCSRIEDGYGLRGIKEIANVASEKTLFLTVEQPSKTDYDVYRRAEVHAFDDAMRIAGLRS